MANTWRSLYFALCLICIGLLCRSWVELRLASNDCELKSCTPLCWPVVWSGLDKETPAITPVGPTHHWPTHRPPVVFLHTPFWSSPFLDIKIIKSQTAITFTGTCLITTVKFVVWDVNWIQFERLYHQELCPGANRDWHLVVGSSRHRC